MATTGHESEAINVQGLKASLQKLKTEYLDSSAYLEDGDSSSVIADFDPQADTLWKKAQVLSAAERAQVQQNIGVREWLNTLTGEKFVSVTATSQTSDVTTLLPASGAGDTIYRVGMWDGSAYNEEYYSDYAWDGTAYVQLNKKSIVGEVFDISEYNAGASYASLSAALGVDGANVPVSVRKGGMSIKYVSNVDNKYVQYRLTLSEFTAAQFTNPANWQGVDDEPTAGSSNLVKSKGVNRQIQFLTDYVAKDGGSLTFPSSGEYAYAVSPATYLITNTGNSSITISFRKTKTGTNYLTNTISSGETREIVVDDNYDWIRVGLSGSINIVLKDSLIYEIDKEIQDVKHGIGDALAYTTVSGYLKWDGALDSSGHHQECTIPEGTTKVFITCLFNLNNNYAKYWILDSSLNIIYKERFVRREEYVLQEIILPAGAKYIYLNGSDSSDVAIYNDNDVIYKSIKELKDITQVVPQIVSDLSDIDKALKDFVRVDPVSSIEHANLKPNGTVDTQYTGTVFKFDIIQGVNKYYVTGRNNLTPNYWCIYWVVDANDNPLYLKTETNPNPQEYNGDLVIDVSSISEASQIWLSLNEEYPHYIEYFSDDFIDISGLKKDVEDIQDEISITQVRNQWNGKKIVWMGTSIPAGQGIGGQNYPTQIATLLNCTVENNAVSGLALEATFENNTWTPKTYGSASLTIAEYQAAGVSNPGNKSYENNMLGKNADLYVFDCEPNNSDGSTELLDIFNVNTWTYTDNSSLESHRDCYVGCLIYLLDKLWTEKADAKVVFVGEYTNGTDFAENYPISEATKAVAEKLRIPYIDLAEKLYYNAFNIGVYVQSDRVHPTQAGQDRIAKMLANELLLIA